MKEAPGFSVCAVLNALRTISGMTSGVEIWVEYFGDRVEEVPGANLMALLVHTGGRVLAGDGDKRRTVHVGIGDAGNEVRRPRAERRQAHPGTPCEPAMRHRQ